MLHVLVSNVINLNKIRHRGLSGYLDVSIDLPVKWIKPHFGSRFKATGIDSSVVSWTAYSREGHQCRSFKASDALLDTILGWAPIDASSAANEPVVNLFDGKPYRVQAPSEWDEHSGVFSPKVIREAVRAIKLCPFDYQALEQHLATLQNRIKRAQTDEQSEYLKLVFRNDNACAMRIRAGCKPSATGIAYYQPEYRTSYTGRITEVGGGAQSCSREMKRVLFDGIPRLKNYDLKRAQAFILLQELEDAGLRLEWVQRYVNEPDANDKRSAALGISKDTYKTCLYATVMGSTHSKYWDKRDNDIYRCLVDECSGDETRAKDMALRVYGILTPLKTEVDAWHDHLMKDAGCRHVDPSRKIRTLRNACGQHFPLDGARADKLARRAAAFILQGQEAAFIHRLTVLGKDNRFVPVNNQHDGIIVIGDIPQSAIDEAATAAGLRYATMEDKSFV